MKKIMFNDALGLTQAVLEGRKTQTRRVATYEDIKCPNIGWAVEGKDVGKGVLCKGEQLVAMSHYAKDEVVAIAQSYKAVSDELCNKHRYAMADDIFNKFYSLAGWTNKMFVKADWMLHHIRITNNRVEKLQGISAEDCLCEGICYDFLSDDPSRKFTYDKKTYYGKAKDAYQALINKLDKKMWECNPFVFVYEFELMD